MRRSVTTLMSGVSVVVVGLGLRAGAAPVSPTAAVAAPAGVVEPTSSPAGRAAVAAAPPRPGARLSTAAPSVAASTPSTAPVRRRSAPVVARPRTSSAPPAPAPKPSPAPTTVTVNGAPADTSYGPVQVQITLRGGRIIRADAIEYPNSSSRDQQINSYAVPQLDDETLQAQSAQIDTVSGATYTSDGYRASLQSALDAAHRAGAR